MDFVGAESLEFSFYQDKPPLKDLVLMHYGMPRRSGRYPWGSGENPYQHEGGDFLSRVEELRKEGFTYTDENGKTWTGDTAIAKSMGLSTTQLRTEIGLANDERRMYMVARAKSLKADGKGATEIGREMGLSESTVRSLLNSNSEEKMMAAKNTAEVIKKAIDEKGMIDVGKGVELELGVSKEMLDKALYILERDGYPVYSGRVEQVTNRGHHTTQKVICPPGTEHKEIYNYDQVHTLKDYVSHDGGATYQRKFTYPESLDSKRLMIRYKEDGGIDKDGIVELRRGVADLSLGESRYSQVRIMVDGKKYIKGMAVYSDDMPDGVDVIFNTNKSKSVAKMDVLKNIKDDPDNPFGSLIKDADQGGQYWYDPKTGKRVSSDTKGAKLGLINKRADEGDWSDWQDALPSQFLAKQSLAMAKKQLNLAKTDKLAEYEEICSITNPTVKKYWLNKFADECDSAAVHLKAAALPGQKYHVIIPVTSMKDTEVYAPNYENGTKLALIRYPHGGTFEIPILTVNNKQPDAKKLLGTDVTDAVGINAKVAERLSGADFDGDTVMCIPTHDALGKVKITSTPPLKGLEGFDPKTAYPERPGMKYMKNTQTEMGKISNLITDMTLAGADDAELAAAVRHSMVVIDAEKHKLDYKQSEIDNNISALKKKYQRHVDADGTVRYGGASTILSRAKGEVSVDKRQGSPIVNIKGSKNYDPSKPEGSYIYKTADDLYYPDRKYDKDTKTVTLRTTEGKKILYSVDDPDAVKKYEPIEKKDPDTGVSIFTNRDGSITYRTKKRQQQSTRMAETDDAYSLVSPAKHSMELLYADYANSMKSLANQARKEMMSTGNLQYSKTAKATYQNEVASLMSKLNDAEKNRVRERAAQRQANYEVKLKQESNPDMKGEDVRKASQQAMTRARAEVGSVSRRDRSIKITDKEWEAIQAGAISENRLKKILDNADPDELRQRSTPKTQSSLSSAQISRIKALAASNYTLDEIAKKMGISPSTVSKYLKGDK